MWKRASVRDTQERNTQQHIQHIAHPEEYIRVFVVRRRRK